MFEDMFRPEVAPIAGALITVFFGIVTLYFKWLIGSFNRLEASVTATGMAATKVQSDLSKMLDIHETKDQTRHEENLYRFEKISVSLARLGSPNGTYGKEIKN